jgi:hypothetical protein
MCTPIVYQFLEIDSCQKFSLVVGIDTVRFGFYPPSMSWELIHRLKPKGWQRNNRCGGWFKKFDGCDLRVWHFPGGLEVRCRLQR